MLALPSTLLPRMALALLLPLLLLAENPRSSPKKKKNVLLLICDDLRTQLKVYGHADYMLTPHIDAFADDALVFDRAFTNVSQAKAAGCWGCWGVIRGPPA